MAHFFDENSNPNNGFGAQDLQFQSFEYGSNSGANNSYGGYSGGNDVYSNINNMQTQPQTISWIAAFSSGDYPDELPLLEELGINFGHMKNKAISVLNPLTPIDKNIFDESDLAGPVIFWFLYGGFQLFAGKVQFNFIYAIAILGWLSIYAILNLMSDMGITSTRTASVLGYCFLPMVLLSSLSILLHLSGFVGLIMSILSIFWCTYSASLMFVTVLSMSEQRLLVAYPVGLLYSAFALLVVMTK
ncbi:hypothetical protein HK100_012099 [Physocladia obscura]|uniref:Protein YIP n=1 Tax=Physocladia obscura TaxID=109957 RepID=A0AAD5XHS1_9FUNG|nr:hypothetical protein HK100_012099 [Physocladia obscura]